MNLKLLKLNIFSLVLMIGANLFSLSVKAQEIDLGEINFSDEPIKLEHRHDSETKPATKGVLRGGVSAFKDLPEEFYGTWSVSGILLESNHPELFRMRTSDVWTYERQNEVITLSNPVSGATASVTVQEVNGNTAIFSRGKNEENVRETEILEITVSGDSFSGTDTIVMNYFRNGVRIKTDSVKYKVKGYKISGPTLKDIFAK